MKPWQIEMLSDLRQKVPQSRKEFRYPKLVGLQKNDEPLYYAEDGRIRVCSLLHGSDIEVAKWINFVYPAYSIEEGIQTLINQGAEYRLKLYHSFVAGGDKLFHIFDTQQGKRSKE